MVEADEAGLEVKLFWQIAGIAVEVANRKTQVGRRRISYTSGEKVEIRKVVVERNPLHSRFCELLIAAMLLRQ